MNFVKKGCALSITLGMCLSFSVLPVHGAEYSEHDAHVVSVSAATVETLTSESISPARLSPAEWQEMAYRAYEAGEYQDFAEILYISQTYNSKPTGKVEVQNIWAKLARKGAIYILRYGQHRLPASIRPWATKIADFLEGVDNLGHHVITLGLMQAGMPYEVAVGAADWIAIVLP